MACYFDHCGNLILRRGDSAKFTIESEDIPFEQYDTAYFAIVDLETLEPVIPELKVPTSDERVIHFMLTKEETDLFPQATVDEQYLTYGYTFKLCADDGTEDTYIPQVESCSAEHVVIKKLPKAYVYPKVIEGDVIEETEE